MGLFLKPGQVYPKKWETLCRGFHIKSMKKNPVSVRAQNVIASEPASKLSIWENCERSRLSWTEEGGERNGIVCRLAFSCGSLLSPEIKSLLTD